MKKFSLLLIAFILCGLMTNAQKKENIVSTYEQKKALFTIKKDNVEPTVKTSKLKDYSVPKYEELLLDSVYFFGMLEDVFVLGTKHLYAYDQFGNESEFKWQYVDETTQEWFSDRLFTHAYDNRGNLTEYSYLYYEENTPNSGQKEIHEYDSNNNNTLEINSEWSTDNSDWLNTSKYIYEYNQDKDTTLQQSFYWYEEWVKSDSIVRVYNTEGQLTEADRYYWDYEASIWILFYNQINTYDENGALISSNFYELDYDTYELFESIRVTFTINENDLPSEMITQNWDYENLTLANYEKETYTYNELNLLSEKYFYQWDSEAIDWMPMYHFTFAYDADLRQNEKITYSHDGVDWMLETTETWLYDDKDRLLENIISSSWSDTRYLFAYDEFDNLVLDADQYLSGEDWENMNIFESGYDENNNILFYYNIDYNYYYGYKTEYTYVDNLLTETFDYGFLGENEWGNNGHSIYTYDENDILTELLYQSWNDAWVDFGKHYYYFSNHEVIAEIDNQLNSEISIYPNPANNSLNFNNISENAVISIYDLSGKQIVNQLNSNNQIDINSLSNGIYIIKIIDNSLTKTAKFVKQ